MWSGICRPHEVLQARRRNLILPSDDNGSVKFALLVIEKPKNRLRSSSPATESARIDPQDLVSALEVVYKDAEPDEPLWPGSSDTFRRRYREIGIWFGLKMLPSQRPSFGEKNEVLDLGSLRSGGATNVDMHTESLPLVQGRGRWNDIRVMRIYLREMQSTLKTIQSSVNPL